VAAKWGREGESKPKYRLPISYGANLFPTYNRELV
jgi:hypothetical protein